MPNLSPDLHPQYRALVEESGQVACQLAESFPTDAWAVAALALLHNLAHDEAGEVKCWRRCLELEAGFSSAYHHLALRAMDRGEHERAEALLREALPAPAAPCVRIHPLVTRARAFIDDRHAEDVSLARVAAALGTTRSYLSTLFRRHCGLTLTDYVHRVRIRRAIVLLRSTADSLAEVAFTVGYRSYRHFHRSFRRLTGLAPKEWVRRARSGQRPPVPTLLPSAGQPRGESPLADAPFDH